MAKPSSLITSIVLVVPGPGSPLAATNAICVPSIEARDRGHIQPVFRERLLDHRRDWCGKPGPEDR